MWEDATLVNTIIEFGTRFMALLLSSLKEMSKGQKNTIYVSQRDIGHQFCRVIMAIASYYKAVHNDEAYLEKGAKDAYTYCLGTKLGIPLDKMANIFNQLKDMLTNVGDDASQLKILLTTLPIHDRIKMVGIRIDDIREKMEDDEIVNLLGNMVQEIDNVGLRSDSENYKRNISSLIYLEHTLCNETKPSLSKIHNQVWLKAAVTAAYDNVYNIAMM
jgi:hypothetical protein